MVARLVDRAFVTPTGPRTAARIPSAGTVAASEETQLLARLRAGDEAAFDILVRRYHGPLKRLARAFVSTEASAEEVVQDTWVAVLAGLDAFEEAPRWGHEIRTREEPELIQARSWLPSWFARSLRLAPARPARRGHDHVRRSPWHPACAPCSSPHAP